jgi:hypothetical protein
MVDVVLLSKNLKASTFSNMGNHRVTNCHIHDTPEKELNVYFFIGFKVKITQKCAFSSLMMRKNCAFSHAFWQLLAKHVVKMPKLTAAHVLASLIRTK